MALTRPRAAQIYDIDYKQATRVVTISNITLSGGAPSQVDGVTLSLNDRILVTGQSTASQNGIYYVTTVGSGSNGTWTRSLDTDATGELLAGTVVMVTEGLIYADTQWKLTTNDPIVIGTTSLTFVQNYSANSISAGTSNVVVTSNANVTISSAGTANVLTVSSTGTVVTGTESVTGNVIGGNILTGGLITATGNITGNYFIGNGSQLTGIASGSSSNITSGTSNVNVVSSGGNVTVGVGGTSNIAVFATTGEYITGVASVSGNITGGNILTGGIVSATGNITGGNISATNHTGTTVSITGNITGGNLSVGTGTVTVGNIVNSNANGVGNIGSSSLYFNTVFAKATSAQYADLAEKYTADAEYAPGTVVEFGGQEEISQTITSHSTAVAGVVSTNPSYLMNSTLNALNVAAVALTGRVPCYVVGKIRKGDRLVSSNHPGVATVLDMIQYQPGCIIGKAMEDYNSDDIGSIEIAVGRT